MDASVSELDRAGERAGWACALVGGLGRALGQLPRALAGAAAAGWMLLIWWLSSGPIDVKPPLPAPGFFWNLAHAPVFGLLAALTATALAPRPLPSSWPDPGRLARVAAFVVAVGWAALDELHQARVASRHGSLLDLVTDATGAACVLWIAAYAGSARAGERGLRTRLAIAVLLCIAAGLTATLGDRPR